MNFVTTIVQLAAGFYMLAVGETLAGCLFLFAGCLSLAAWSLSTQPSTEDHAPEPTMLENIPLARGSLITMPNGWTITPLEPEGDMITRSTTRTEPVGTTEAKVIQGRIGSLNNEAIGGREPYTLKLKRVDFGRTQEGWVVTEFWEPIS